MLLLQWLKENSLPYFIVGNGSNLLVLDQGIRGVVISMTHCQKDISHTILDKQTVLITAGAAAWLNTLCKYASGKGFKGINFALGIPATVGGAIVMNAGTDQGCMADIVNAVVILSGDGESKRIEKDDLMFRYRRLDWKSIPGVSGMQNPIIIAGEFCLSMADKHKIQTDAQTVLQK